MYEYNSKQNTCIDTANSKCKEATDTRYIKVIKTFFVMKTFHESLHSYYG